jgi:hypothetical protein
MARYRIRMQVRFRNLEGLKARRRAKTARQKAALLVAVVENAEEEFNVAQALCNRLTGYMASMMILRFTRDGHNYFLGFDRSDFVGKTNPVTGEVIKFFYPVVVIEGSVNYAGNDFFAATRIICRARSRARIIRALAA